LPQLFLSKIVANQISGMEDPYNISIYPGTGTVDGRSGDHVLISPAYTVTAEEVVEMVELTATVIADFFAQMEA
jgi:hypothetical protein